MALRFLLLVAFFIFCVVQVPQSTAEIEQVHNQEVEGANGRLLQSIDCEGLCKVRCNLHSRPNVCHRACGTCCVRCKCVPPGTSGNREMCGTCYTEMKTHGNKAKCP